MQPTISSSSNNTVKHLKRLAASSKARRESGEHIAEGIHLVESFLDSGGRPLRFVFAESAGGNEEVADLLRQLRSTGAEEVAVTDKLFRQFSSMHAAVGILLTFTPPAASGTPELQQTTVLLEDIQDPGNLGTILRTAAAVGVKDVVLSSECASPWSPKALRSGMGAQFELCIYENADLPSVVSRSPIPTLVTTLSPESKSLYETNLSGSVVWIFCNEGQGVSTELSGVASQHIRVPQASTAVESLNVSAAAAVCLYEHYRQNINT